MPSLTLRRALLPAALVAALTSVSVASPALAAPAADSAAAAKAAALLAHDLSDEGTIVGSYDDGKGNTVTYTDYGRTLDAAIALLAQGGHDETLGRALTTVEDPQAVKAYTQGAPGDKADAAYVGATAKLAFVVAATGGDPTKVGGVDLLAQLTSLEDSQTGRFADRSSFGNYANLFGHSFALLALKQAGQNPSNALVQGLTGAQCADGSFPESYQPATGKPCTGSVDATGLALQALAAVGQGSAQPAQSATSWLTGQQRADGSFPGQAPVNSTGYAVAGLDAAGAPIGSALTYLTSQQNGDGGLRTGATGATGSDDFATAQALPALAGKTFAAGARTVARQATLVLSTTRTVATHAATVTVHAPAGSVVDLYAYSRPSTTFAVVRSATVGSTGALTWTVAPLTNTRLYAQKRGGAATPQTVLSVATALSLNAARTAPRTYVFSGRSIPARAGGLIVSLYRSVDGVHQILTAQTRANAQTGSWSLTRTFSGVGRFTFVVRTGGDVQNAAGSSNTRSVLVS
jgi:hypothetical protein